MSKPVIVKIKLALALRITNLKKLMRKNQVKQILYLWLIGIIFGCSTPEFLMDEQNKSNRNIKMKILNTEAIKKHPRLFTRVSKLNEVILQRNANQKEVSSSIYNFNINTNLCKMITVDGFTTYTFEIIREQDNGFFENLVVKELANGTLETKLYKYNVTAQEKENILNGIDVDMTNKISTLLIDDPNFVSDIFSKIYFSTFCYEASSVFVPGQACKNGHLHPDLCDLQGSEAPTLGSYQTVYIMVTCPDSGGGGGSGPTGPTDTGGFDGGGTSPTGGGNLLELDDGPCARLKRLFDTSKGNLKQYFPALFNGIPTNVSGENAVSLKKNSNGVYNNVVLPSSSGSTIPIPTGGTNYSAIHTHCLTDYPIFSIADLITLHGMLNQASSYNVNEISFMLACKDFNNVNHLYAITCNNLAQFNQFYGSLIVSVPNWSVLSELEQKIFLNGIFQKQLEEEDINDVPDFEITFLKFINNSGVNLYKANSNLTNWSEISLNTSQNNSTVYSIADKNVIPCN